MPTTPPVKPPSRKRKIFNLSLFAIMIFLSWKACSLGSGDANLSQSQKDSIAEEERVTQSLSPWDGSQSQFVEYVKKHMNDPNSFEHVETRYFKQSQDTLILFMTYRGKNAFGGVVTEKAKAIAKVSGELISVTGN